MGRKNRNRKEEHGGTSKEDEEFLSDPMFAKALARTEIMPVGWATGTTVTKIAKQRKLVTNEVPSSIRTLPKSRSEAHSNVPEPSNNNNEIVEDDNVGMEADSIPIEDNRGDRGIFTHFR